MRYRVFLIDNDEATVNLLSLIFRPRGYEIVTLTSPLDCPLYAEDDCGCPQGHACGDLMITDNRMDRITGLDFIERQLRGGCRGAIQNKAIVSGFWTPEERTRARSLGCQIFTKPFLFKDILAWVEEREKEFRSQRKLTSLALQNSVPGLPFKMANSMSS